MQSHLTLSTSLSSLQEDMGQNHYFIFQVWDEYLEKRKESREKGIILPRLIRKIILSKQHLR